MEVVTGQAIARRVDVERPWMFVPALAVITIPGDSTPPNHRVARFPARRRPASIAAAIKLPGNKAG